MKHPTPTRADHLTFCVTEEWTGLRQVRDHLTFELPLRSGDILRTRISRPPGRTDYGPSVFGHILRDQLSVTAEEFWACVTDGVLPDRGQVRTQSEALPADLVHLLRTRGRMSLTEIAALTRAEAIALVATLWGP